MGDARRNVPETPPEGTRGPNVASASVSSKCESRVRITTLLPSSPGSCENSASMNITAMGNAAQHRAKNPSQHILPRRGRETDVRPARDETEQRTTTEKERGAGKSRRGSCRRLIENTFTDSSLHDSSHSQSSLPGRTRFGIHDLYEQTTVPWILRERPGNWPIAYINRLFHMAFSQKIFSLFEAHRN